ncbi:MAG: adenylyltransferase/cytidyltransferase family protein [Patescibacteria group bacterium]
MNTKYNCDCRYDCGKVIHSLDELKEKVKELRKQNLTISLTQGTWDMVHIGHARYIQAAKMAADVLIVGVDSDAKVRARKGPDRPVVPEAERMEIITHLRWPDYVILKEKDWPKWALTKTIRPDVLIETKEINTMKNLPELQKYCGEVRVLEPMATTSTSAKLRLLNIATANKIEKMLTPKITKAIDEVLFEIKGGDKTGPSNIRDWSKAQQQ